MSSAAPNTATEKKKIEISHMANREGRSDKCRCTSHASEMSPFEVGEGAVERGYEHLYHRGRDRERRSNENVVAANAIHGTLHRIRHDARFECIFLNSRGHVRISRKWLARLRVPDDFDG